MKLLLLILLAFGLGGCGLIEMSGADEFFTDGKGFGDSVGSNQEVGWSFDGDRWVSSGEVGECEGVLELESPVDVELVSGVLYPGQIRGGDYKAHGGFRFDESKTGEVEVRAVMDGYVLKASRYLSGGEVQKQLFYVNECGVMVMHDHLVDVSNKLEAVFATLSEPREGDSRTTPIHPRVEIQKGEVLATSVGIQRQSNFFVDFGVYDLRQTNGRMYDDEFSKTHMSVGEYGRYGLCWLDLIGESAGGSLKNLPAGGHEGKVSDYCE